MDDAVHVCVSGATRVLRVQGHRHVAAGHIPVAQGGSRAPYETLCGFRPVGSQCSGCCCRSGGRKVRLAGQQANFGGGGWDSKGERVRKWMHDV